MNHWEYENMMRKVFIATGEEDDFLSKNVYFLEITGRSYELWVMS